jgi:formylglycine-generating enzyme required for sulfatase activity/tRNA A-37 threonylcarbamoyl transferase component Bud32
MSEAERVVKCPACAREFTLAADSDVSHLVCPHCEGEIPEEALRGMSEIAEELAPGFRPGQRFGNYVIESLLGTGGMAVVFKGRQLSLNRHVAIKILPKELMKKKLFVERFESEGAVLASLNHANIVGVIDRGVESGTYYLVMEYVEGETLKDVIQREKVLPPERIFPIAHQALAGLEYAHHRGVVHRDVKPGNLMISRDGIVKIADFGLAHLAKAQGGLDVTRENQAMGTLKYMAPEQLGDARAVDGRADIYSFGVCLYECLTGRLPLGMFKMPSEWDDSLDLRWDDVILRALKMDPEERYDHAETMARAIREIASTPRVTVRQREEAEEAAAEEAAAAPRVISPTACAACGQENPPEAHQCEKCNASLGDLFDACPKCERFVRIDVSPCPKCGADLASYRSKRRLQAEELQNDAKRLAANGEFDKALSNLRKLLKFRTREYAPLRHSAEAWIERISRRRDRHLQRVYEAGERLIAEGHAQRGLVIWESLPEGYRDVAERRAEILAARKRADADMTEGDELYKAGGLEAAIVAWDRAARFYPHDQRLHKHLNRAKIQLGNLNLRRGYVEEAKDNASRGNFNEAMALCRKALALDAEDGAARAFLRRLEEHKEQLAGKRPKKKRRLREIIPIRPRTHRERKPLTRRQILSISLVGALVVLVVLVFAVALPMRRARRERLAAGLASEARSLLDSGRETEALKLTDRIIAEYPATAAAERAKELAAELRTLFDQAQELCNHADSLAEGGGLAKNIAGFKEFERLLGGSAVTESAVSRAYASARLEELRKAITDEFVKQAAVLQDHGKWRDALAVYNRALREFGSPADRVGPLAERASRRIAKCEEQLAAAERAAAAGQWSDALNAARVAVDFVPQDVDANRMLGRAAAHVPPPSGMVHVPPGEYSVGRPSRTVNFPHGFYIDRTEVSRARYAEFLIATGRAAPPAPLFDEPIVEEENGSLPVSGVTWDEARSFAQWAGMILPSEEMFECAARGPSAQSYSWGNDWDPLAGAFGFAPVPTDAEIKDRSFCGAMQLAGNVAEWSATGVKAPEQPLPEIVYEPGTRRTFTKPEEPKPQTFHVVKGSSWLGIEDQRSTKPVTRPLRGEDAGAILLLTPDEKQREKGIRFPTDLQIAYLGAAGTDTANVGVRRWVWEWAAWAGSRFPAFQGKAIGGPANMIVQAPSGARALRRVNLETGCEMAGQQPNEWLDVKLPCGALMRLPKTDIPTPRIVEMGDVQPAPTISISLAEAADAASRMAGRDDARYLNVGFRVAKLVWTPPKVGEIRRVDEE